MRRLAITGSSGYLGTELIEHLRREHAGVEILGLDLRAPRPETAAPHRFVELDILSPELGNTLREFRPDTVVHAAFVLEPIRDRKKARRIDVDGSRNLLAAAPTCGAKRVMLVSSAMVYGAWPDNPLPMDENHPLRPAKLQYAADKVAVERLAADFAERHPAIAVTCVRPAIIGGPGMDNFLREYIFAGPLLPLLDGNDTPLQFVHEEDVAEAIAAILLANARGAFNVAPPDWNTISEIAAQTRRKTLRISFRLACVIDALGWMLHMKDYQAPPAALQFTRYPWAVAPARLTRELGFKFRYSSLDTLRAIVRAHR